MLVTSQHTTVDVPLEPTLMQQQFVVRRKLFIPAPMLEGAENGVQKCEITMKIATGSWDGDVVIQDQV